jgi:hypothetical protein
MGTRRDDIPSSQRAQIAIEVLSPQRPRGTVSRLASENEVSRQTIYDIAAAGKQVLITHLTPGAHGPQAQATTIEVNRDRLVRSSLVLTEAGVSQRDVSFCLAEMLDTRRSPSWVNMELAKIEEEATKVNQSWEPTVAESKSGDEIYSNGQPNLMVVGNDSLYIYALTRQPSCDGETWGCVLLDVPPGDQFASDGGVGLAAGVKLAGLQKHQLDWDHLLRPLWGQATRLAKQGVAAMEAVEERAVKFMQANTPGRLAQHLTAWERLSTDAEAKMTRSDAFELIARQVDREFALIDLDTGHLRDPLTAIEHLRQLGQQVQTWTGPIYEKLGNYLINGATALFSYQPALAEALKPLLEQWGPPAIRALSRLWQIEADEKRHPQPVLERQARQHMWAASLEEATALLGEQLWQAWADLTRLLGRAWRGSMLAECVNGLLRPVLDGRQHTDQGCLELFRFLHNARSFARGKRANHSPAELAGLDVPDDPLILLGLAPKVSI